MKALILAAGLGTRMRPITETTPKPLCPFFGVPSIDYAIRQVCSVTSEIAVNTHYLSDQLSNHISRYHGNKDIHISHEPELLDTGGAISNISEWIGEDDLLIYNSDIICDIQLEALVTSFQQSSSLATMVLLDQHVSGTAPVTVLNHAVVYIGGSQPSVGSKHTFSGIHLLSREFTRQIPINTVSSVIDAYQKVLGQKKRVSAYLHDSYWTDLGTPKSYWKSHIDVINDPSLFKALGIGRLRGEYSKPKLAIDQTSQSAYPYSHSSKTAYTKSLVDLQRPEKTPVKVSHSIVYADSLDSSESYENVIVVGKERLSF